MNTTARTTALTICGTVALLASGCTIRFSSNKVVDGGVFRSTDYGETWQQRVFVSQQGKKTITISDADVSGFTFSPHNPDEIMMTTFGGGIYRSLNNGDSWSSLGVAKGTYLAFLYDPVSPLVLYTATGSTVLKSIDDGQEWEIVYVDTRGEGIAALEIDPDDGDIVFAGTSGGTILKSTDAGHDWKVVGSLGDSIRSLYAHTINTDILFALTNNKGLFRSTDHGETWEALTSLREFQGSQTAYQLSFSPYTPDVLYLGSNYGILTSQDAGETWTPIQTLLPFSSVPIRTVLVEPLDSRVIYFTVNNLLHKTDDGGTTWRTIETIPTGRLIVRAAHHPVRPGDLYLGTFEVKK